MIARDLNNDNQITNNEYVIETPEEVMYLYSSYQLERGAKRYELVNHLGNVLTAISDKKTANFTGTNFTHFTAERISATDYSPFGAPLAGRTWNGGEYRFAFNGKEKDDETYSDGNVYDYGFRIYNRRLGKFLSVDPLFKTFPFYTSYQFASNMPVKAVNIDGLESDVNLNECENAFIHACLDYDFSKHASNSVNSAKSIVSLEVSGQAMGVGGGVQVGSFEVNGNATIGEVSACVDGNGNFEVTLTTAAANGKDTFFGNGVTSGVSLLKVMIWSPQAMKNNSILQEVIGNGGIKTPETSKKAKAETVENPSHFDDFSASLSLTIGAISATIKTNLIAIGEPFKKGIRLQKVAFQIL